MNVNEPITLTLLGYDDKGIVATTPEGDYPFHIYYPGVLNPNMLDSFNNALKANDMKPLKKLVTIKTCPLCGHPVDGVDKISGDYGYSADEYIIQCKKCDLKLVGKTAEEAIETWNKRI